MYTGREAYSLHTALLFVRRWWLFAGVVKRLGPSPCRCPQWGRSATTVPRSTVQCTDSAVSETTVKRDTSVCSRCCKICRKFAHISTHETASSTVDSTVYRSSLYISQWTLLHQRTSVVTPRLRPWFGMLGRSGDDCNMSQSFWFRKFIWQKYVTASSKTFSVHVFDFNIWRICIHLHHGILNVRTCHTNGRVR